MKKISYLLAVLFVLGFVSQCNARAQENGLTDFYSTEFRFSDEYKIDEFSVASTRAPDPHGIILLSDGKLLVSDWKANALILLDRDCNFIKRIGDLGSAPLEFMKPTGMTTYQGDLYIIDSGNNRIQILNEDFSYKDSIRIPEIVGSWFTDIAVNSDHIYINSNSIMDVNGGIYRGSMQEEFVMITDILVGPLYTQNDTIYTINTFECQKVGEDYQGRVGRNQLFFVHPDGLQAVCDLPPRCAPLSFTINQERLICLSGSSYTVNAFTMNGDYEYSLVDFLGLYDDISYDAVMACEGVDSLYIAGYVEGKLIRVSKI